MASDFLALQMFFVICQMIWNVFPPVAFREMPAFGGLGMQHRNCPEKKIKTYIQGYIATCAYLYGQGGFNGSIQASGGSRISGLTGKRYTKAEKFLRFICNFFDVSNMFVPETVMFCTQKKYEMAFKIPDLINLDLRNWADGQRKWMNRFGVMSMEWLHCQTEVAKVEPAQQVGQAMPLPLALMYDSLVSSFKDKEKLGGELHLTEDQKSMWANNRKFVKMF